MPTIYTEVEVDVALDDFDDDDLIEELERRGRDLDIPNTNASELVDEIYAKRRLGKDYQRELDELIYQVTGKFV